MGNRAPAYDRFIMGPDEIVEADTQLDPTEMMALVDVALLKAAYEALALYKRKGWVNLTLEERDEFEYYVTEYPDVFSGVLFGIETAERVYLSQLHALMLDMGFRGKFSGTEPVDWLIAMMRKRKTGREAIEMFLRKHGYVSPAKSNQRTIRIAPEESYQ